TCQRWRGDGVRSGPVEPDQRDKRRRGRRGGHERQYFRGGGRPQAGQQIREELSNRSRRTAMRTVDRLICTLGVAIVAASAVAADRTFAQATDPNAAPNPYKLEENWAQ